MTLFQIIAAVAVLAIAVAAVVVMRRRRRPPAMPTPGFDRHRTLKRGERAPVDKDAAP